MPRTLQPKKLRVFSRYFEIKKAGFKNNEVLRLKIEEKSGEEINRSTFDKVMTGILISGPMAELIMRTTSELTGKKIETLWPELKDAA